MKKKLITGFGIAGLGVVLLSFANGNEPKMKKYEVIRSVDGQVSTFDTLVPEHSSFTPDDYLAHLGFSEDDHIRIIQIPALDENMLTAPYPPAHIPVMDSVVVMNFEGSHGMTDSIFSFVIHTGAPLTDEEHQQLMMEKNIVIHQLDSLNGEIMELERMIEIQISDSMIGSAKCLQKDSTITMMHTIIIHDDAGGAKSGHIRTHVPEGEPDFERHIEDGSMKADFMVYGEQKDFTILLVTDGSSATPKSHVPVSTAVVPENAVKLYPNPADKEVAIQLNFDSKAPTLIFVTDANGKEVMRLNLGEFSGNYNQTIDVAKWSKGIYFVNIDRPGTRLVEKLVVE